MTSPVLALFIRSLREDARSRLTYLARAGMVGVIILFLFTTIVFSDWSGAPGLDFFRIIVNIQAVFITLAGLSYFASAITEEKEEQTLGLLRMTDLNPLSILLGKSTSRLAGALLLLLAQFPFTLLAITLGGVAQRQIVASYCTLGAYLFLLSNLALLSSVIFARTGPAAFATGSVLALATGIGGVLLPGNALVHALPFAQLNTILATRFAGAPLSDQVQGNLAAGVGCFLLAWIFFDRLCSGRDDASAVQTEVRGAWQRGLFAPGRPRVLPIVWKDAHFLHGGRGMLFAKFLGYGALLALVWASVSRIPGTTFAEFGWMALGLMSLALTLELGFAASRCFRVEIDGQTLPTLALAPLTIRGLVQEKTKACIGSTLPALCYLVLSGACLVLAGFGTGTSPFERAAFFLFACMFISAFAVPQVHFFVHLTGYLSLRMKRGALPLGIAITWVVLMVTPFFGFITMGFGFLAYPFACVLIGNALREKSIALLEERIAE